jgi:hypothetical protein
VARSAAWRSSPTTGSTKRSRPSSPRARRCPRPILDRHLCRGTPSRRSASSGDCFAVHDGVMEGPVGSPGVGREASKFFRTRPTASTGRARN